MDMRLANLMDVLRCRQEIELNVYSGDEIDEPTEIFVGSFKQIDTCIKVWNFENCLVMDVIPKGNILSIGILEDAKIE